MHYRFENFVFDPDRGLLRAGQAIALEPRAADLLRYLIENAGRIVSRDELCEKIWDGAIVSDAAISTQIRAVRKALGDDREQQRFIRTHPRRGFSFVAAVEAVGSDLSPERFNSSSNSEIAYGQHQRTSPLARILGFLSPRLSSNAALGAVAVMGFVLLAIVINLWNRVPDTGHSQVSKRGLSIVVLPFDNLSMDSTKDYLVDAFTEDLVTDLSRIRDAFVISRSTSFTYRGKDIDAAKAAADLGVRYVLEGSLRIDGETVRVNAQLIDGTENYHLWSDRYERRLADLFHLKNNVTGRIAAVLRAELRKVENERQGPEITRDAWDYALRGNVLLYNHQSVTDYQEAHAYLSKAVALDPTISSAWGGLAFVHFVASVAPIPDITRPDSAQLSLNSALKATQVDPMNAEPYWLVGAGYARTRQPERGMPACRTAIELNPNMDCGHVCAGLVHMALGEPEQAVPYFKQALELNPRFRPFTKEKYLGLAYIQSGRNDLAVIALNRALSTAPKDRFANLAVAAALALDGQEEAAKITLTRYLHRNTGDRPSVEALRKNLAWLGPGIERLMFGLKRAGL